MNVLWSKPLPICPDGPVLRNLLLAMALCFVLPGHAAPKSSPGKPSADKRIKTTKTKRVVAPMATAQPTTAIKPETAAAKSAPPVQPAATSVVADIPPSRALTAPPVPVAAPAPSAPVAAPATNPYLAGWFVPTPVNDLPRLAAQQLSASVQWTYATVVSLPGNVIEALPKIRRVFPTGGRELWVASLKCPVEMVTGQYFTPANALRDTLNGLLGTINEMRLLNFDIQLVCS